MAVSFQRLCTCWRIVTLHRAAARACMRHLCHRAAYPYVGTPHATVVQVAMLGGTSGAAMVVSVLEAGPADVAGLAVNDFIIGVDGADTSMWKTKEAFVSALAKGSREPSAMLLLTVLKQPRGQGNTRHLARQLGSGDGSTFGAAGAADNPLSRSASPAGSQSGYGFGNDADAADDGMVFVTHKGIGGMLKTLELVRPHQGQSLGFQVLYAWPHSVHHTIAPLFQHDTKMRWF